MSNRSNVDKAALALDQQILEEAAKLPMEKFMWKVEALKVHSQFKAMINRAPEDEEGSDLASLREELEDTDDPPEPDLPDPDGNIVEDDDE